MVEVGNKLQQIYFYYSTVLSDAQDEKTHSENYYYSIWTDYDAENTGEQQNTTTITMDNKLRAVQSSS